MTDQPDPSVDPVPAEPTPLPGVPTLFGVPVLSGVARDASDASRSADEADPAFPPPVARLLRLGEPDVDHTARKWPNYRAVPGVTPEHVPDLLRIVRDWERYYSAVDPETDDMLPESYAPIHAWRSLGQLRAVDAVGPLLRAFEELQADDDEFSMEEVPAALGMVGPPALDELEAFLADDRRNEWALDGAARAVAEVAAAHADARPRAIGILTAVLERHADLTPGFNAAVIGHLMKLKAADAVPAIRRAFAADRVDGTVCGNFAEVRRVLGIDAHPDDPPDKSMADYWREYHPEMAAIRDRFGPRSRAGREDGSYGYQRPPARSADRDARKAKDKRKAAKKAKRQNRKR